VQVIRGNVTEQDKKDLEKEVFTLKKTCDTVLLACTDLQHILKGDYVDSFDILVKAAFRKTGVITNQI